MDATAKVNERYRMPLFAFGSVSLDIGNLANVNGCLFSTNDYNDFFTRICHVWKLDDF